MANTQTEAAKDAGATPRPTGKNSEQDSEIAALKASVEALTKLVEAKPAAAINPNALPPQGGEAIKAIKARRSKRPKTYLALEDGIDYKQGVIKAGESFTTDQPKGAWMEEVGDADEEVDEDA